MKKLAVLIIALVFLVPLTRTAFAAPVRNVTPQVMTNVTRLPVKGTIQSNETYVTVFPTMSVTASGTGDGTQLGKFTVRYHTEISLLDLSLTESVQLMGANGNSLNAEAVGQASENRTPNMLNLVAIYTITSGTGQFSGASGTITLNRLVSLTTGATASTFEGYILIP
jgi:hypothetical protein